MKKLTDWHQPHVKPVHVGVYSTDAVKSVQTYQKWNGEYWCRFHTNPKCSESEYEESVCQNVSWRGYTTKQD